METYCVRCKKYAANKTAKQNRLMILSNCAICAKKKSTCIKKRYFK